MGHADPQELFASCLEFLQKQGGICRGDAGACQGVERDTDIRTRTIHGWYRAATIRLFHSESPALRGTVLA